MSKQTSYENFKRFFPSGASLARYLNISRQAISQWTRYGIPPMRRYQIEVITKGKVVAGDIEEEWLVMPWKKSCPDNSNLVK